MAKSPPSMKIERAASLSQPDAAPMQQHPHTWIPDHPGVATNPSATSRRHDKIAKKLVELIAFAPVMKARLEHVSQPGAEVPAELAVLVDAQLCAAIGIFTSDARSTESQLAGVANNELGAARVSKKVRACACPPGVHAPGYCRVGSPQPHLAPRPGPGPGRRGTGHPQRDAMRPKCGSFRRAGRMAKGVLVVGGAQAWAELGGGHPAHPVVFSSLGTGYSVFSWTATSGQGPQQGAGGQA